jgi:hypothetical protein
MNEIFGDSDDTVSVTPPGGTKAVRLRYPTFQQWHELAKAHQGLDGGVPDAKLIARTIATCVADESGKPLGDAGIQAVMAGPPKRVMWLYRKCWETVLKSDDETVEQIEKN